MRFAVENPEKMLEFQQNITDLKNVQGATFDITVAQKILGPDLAKSLGEKSVGAFFKKYNKQNKIVFLSQFQQTMTMLQEGDVDMIKSYNAWNASNGMKKSYVDYAAWQSDRTVTSQGVDNTGVSSGQTSATEKQGPDPSFLDPYVESLRNASNFQQKLTVGFAASLKALRGQEGALTKFAGLAMRLKSSGADTNFIQAVLGGSQEDIDKIINRTTGKLTKAGEDAIRIAKKVENAKIGMAYVLASSSERLEKDNQLYSAGLEVISGKEKKINGRYDARAKALDEIGKLQDRNNQKQSDTLTLADALSKGDIAGAAKAALQAQQNSQKQALEDAKSNLETARKNELDAIELKILGKTETRSSLEEKIATNSAAIAVSKLAQLDREIKIGKNAVITAKASAITLANGQKIAGLKSTIGGGVSGSKGTKTTSPADPVEPTSPGATATTAGAAIAGLAKTGKFGGGAPGNVLASLKTGLMDLSSSGQKAKVKAADKAIIDQGAIGVNKDFASYDSTKKKYTAVDRNKILSSDLAAYDEWVAKFGNLTKAKSNIVNQYEEKKTQAFESFPPEIQTALATLKSYNEQKKVATEEAATAKTAFEKSGIQKGPDGRYRGSPGSSVNDEKSVAAYNKAYGPLQAAMNKAQGLTRTITTIQESLNAKGYDMGMTEFYIGKRYNMGGMVYAQNGMHIAKSKYSLGTDTIPAMLTPGEFVMRKAAVDSIGSQELSKMNARGKDGMSRGESVYNYSITVNANSSDASDIADAVLNQIKRIDSRRIRSNTI
jgi:hypothetical protein